MAEEYERYLKDAGFEGMLPSSLDERNLALC
jgi:hypothetical protein